MSRYVTWPRIGGMTPEEKLLREIFGRIGVPEEKATSAELRTIVERYKRDAIDTEQGGAE